MYYHIDEMNSSGERNSTKFMVSHPPLRHGERERHECAKPMARLRVMGFESVTSRPQNAGGAAASRPVVDQSMIRATR